MVDFESIPVLRGVPQASLSPLTEQAIIEGTGRSATITAQGWVEALVIPAEVVERLLVEKAFLLNVARGLSAKLREATVHRAVRYRQEEQLFAEFSAHVSQQVASQLLSSGSDYGKPRFVDAVLLMADIRSFTESSLRMEPEQIARELGPYLDAVVQIIHRHSGMVDKFIGDAVLAVWGIVPCGSDPASGALDCAREMVATASKMTFGAAPVRIGVGLNAGKVFAGNVGGIGKRQFTVLGTPVNTVARLESESKALRADIVAGETLYERLPQAKRAGFQKQVVQLKGLGERTVYSLSQEAGIAAAQEVK